MCTKANKKKNKTPVETSKKTERPTVGPMVRLGVCSTREAVSTDIRVFWHLVTAGDADDGT